MGPRSSVGLEQETSKLKVAGSNPAGGTNEKSWFSNRLFSLAGGFDSDGDFPKENIVVASSA